MLEDIQINLFNRAKEWREEKVFEVNSWEEFLAPIHVVIVPVFKTEEDLQKIEAAMAPFMQAWKKMGITVKFDHRDTLKPGFKFAEWELKGVPVRLAVGNRDLENGTIEIARRDTKEKNVVAMDGVIEYVSNLLEDIQINLFNRAKEWREEKVFEVNSWEEFLDVIQVKEGFAMALRDIVTGKQIGRASCRERV